MMKRNLLFLGAAALVPCVLPPALGADPTAATIVEKMSDVTDDLNKTETGKPVQAKQKVIVNDLDELIAALEKKAQNARNGVKRNNPTRGMADSMISAGTGGIGTLVNPSDAGKDWGKLSPRERDRILQSMSEGFPPEYRTVLERYYRRLAEEKGQAKEQGTRKDSSDKP
jgi:hypothetical protein